MAKPKESVDPKAEAARQIKEEYGVEEWTGGIMGGTTINPETGEKIMSFHYKPKKKTQTTKHKVSPEELARHKASEAKWLGYEEEVSEADAAAFEYAVGGMDPQEHMDMLKGYTKDSADYRDAVIEDFEETMYEHSKLLEDTIDRLGNPPFTEQELRNMLNDIRFYENSIEGLQNEIDYVKDIDETQFRVKMQTIDKVK